MSRGRPSRRLCLLCLSGVSFCLGPAAIAHADIETVGSRGTGPGQYQRLDGVAVDVASNVYTADPQLGRVLEYDSSGSFVGVAATIPGARDIDVDPAGNLYVGTGSTVTKVSPLGTTLWTISVGELEIAVSGGTLWIARSSRTQIEGRSTADGSVSVPAWTLAGGALADDIAIAPNGNLLVTNDQDEPTLTEYSPSGSVVREVMEFAFHSTRRAEYVVDADAEFDLYASPVEFSSVDPKVYRYDSDGVQQGEPIELDNGGAEAGDIEVAPNGVVWISIKDLSVDEEFNDTELVRVDPDIPIADLSPLRIPEGIVCLGESVGLDRGFSRGTLASIVRYEWDLDGDGTFEVDNGPDDNVDAVLPRGFPEISLRVTADSGVTRTATTILSEVVLCPPVGNLGISINGGDLFTNDPNVTISMIWTLGNRVALVSNDGGFMNPGVLPVEPTVPWTLEAGGSDRIPRTVYVRFDDPAAPTFQDDIVLDTTAPEIQSARIAGRRAVKVKLDADDNASGVSEVQFLFGKSGQPTDWRPYAPSLRVAGKGRKVLVRVKDGAGNHSRWAKAKRKRKRPARGR
jgi:hypothetical protein